MDVFQYSEPDEQDQLRLRLLPLICNLNAMPLRQFHASWLHSAGVWNDIETLLQHPESYSDLSAFMMKRYRLKSVWIHDFTELRHRLLLVDSKSLNNLAFYLGLVVISPYLRKVIDGKRIKQLAEAIGAKSFEFARKKAAFYNPVFIGKVIKVDEEKIAPECVVEEIIRKGVACLGLLFWDDEKALKSRLAIKLPKDNARFILNKAYETVEPELLDNYRNSIFKILMKLMKEVEPTWQTIFV